MTSRPPGDRRRWDEIERLLDQLLDLSPTQQEAFLANACGQDPDLRAEIDALLLADRRENGILEASVGEHAMRVLAAVDGEGDTVELMPASGNHLGPYQLLRVIGSGGMGVVYEAVDTRLDRKVAIKLLPPEYSRDPAAKKRFLREARAASSLDHPNLCTIYDIGANNDSYLFIVMAHYNGETLAGKIARGPLSIEEAIDLSLQIGRGLDRAHEAGIVHRDIKPRNLMVTERGQIKILDFGIAKIAGESGITRTGTVLGTPAYMSPEQADAKPVDSRTDIWSLGVILYQMIAGKLPFRGEQEQAIIHSILHREPEPLGRLRDDVPESVERIVARALAKNPDQRYQRVDEMVRDLASGRAPSAAGGRLWRRGWLVPAAAVLALGLLVLAGQWPPVEPVQPREEKTGEQTAIGELPIVAVIPFANQTGDPAWTRAGRTIAQAVTDDLSRSPHLYVLSAVDSASLANARNPAERAQRARVRGIAILVTGEIRPGPSGVTAVARVIEADRGRQLATRQSGVVAGTGDVLALARPFAVVARRALGVPLTEAIDVYAADFSVRDPQAYDDYVEGLAAFVDYRYDDAARAFAAALARAPDFTMARYRLALVLAATGENEQANQEIQRAVAEADRLGDRDAHYVRAAAAYIAYQYDRAIATYRAIIAQSPYATEARVWLAQMFTATRRHRDELEVVNELIELDPDRSIVWSMSTRANLAVGNFDRAVLHARRYIEMEPKSANGHHMLGRAYQAQAEFELAAQEYAAALQIDAGFHFARIDLGKVEVVRERRDVAEQQLTAVISDAGADPSRRADAGFALAALYRSQGRFRRAERTLAELEKSIVAEKVREAMALSVRGTSLMELGDTKGAARLIDRALDRAPDSVPPTRYLFARGLLELRLKEGDALAKTIAAIRSHALPPDAGDWTEDKAAAYLRGLQLVGAGEADKAIAQFQRAVSLTGYEYGVYRLGLARAYLAAGKLAEALAAANQAAARSDAKENRLDLELDRTRARLVLARIHHTMGRTVQATAHARAFLERWTRAEPALPELAEARRLASLR